MFARKALTSLALDYISLGASRRERTTHHGAKVGPKKKKNDRREVRIPGVPSTRPRRASHDARGACCTRSALRCDCVCVSLSLSLSWIQVCIC